MNADERSERLERLFRQTFRRVMACCLRRASEAAAHDAVAEVYAVAWRKRRQLPADDEEAVLWLLGIARRASRASCTAMEPTPPAAPWMSTLWPVIKWAWSNRACQAVSPEIGSAAAVTWSTSAGSGARLRASTAVYWASEPLRLQSVRPNTRCPTVRPVVP